MTFMMLHNDTAGAILYQTAVEVEIWEGYFPKDRSGFTQTLFTYTLDNGPLKEPADGKMIFRFTLYDWQKNVQSLLTRNNVHFNILRSVGIDPLQQLLRKKIFLADDDPEIGFCLSTILESAGYHVKFSPSGKSILEGSYSWVDLFILDRKMPDVDGLELCRHLRTKFATRDTPVIMISAAPQSGNEALAAGANDYIEKPFHVHYLLNVVSKFTRDTNRPS
jgi:CheY-like chemotaxis protein